MVQVAANIAVTWTCAKTGIRKSLQNCHYFVANAAGSGVSAGSTLTVEDYLTWSDWALHNFALKEVEEQAASDAEAEVDVPKVAGVGVHLEA